MRWEFDALLLSQINDCRDAKGAVQMAVEFYFR
jgi:hypothetical protein